MESGRRTGHRSENDHEAVTGLRDWNRLSVSSRRRSSYARVRFRLRVCTQRLCTQPHFGRMLGAKCDLQFASEGGNLSCLVFMDGTIQGEEYQLFSSISWTKVFKHNHSVNYRYEGKIL